MVSTQSFTTITAKSRTLAATTVARTQEFVFRPVTSSVIDSMRAQREFKIGANEAVIPFLRIDHEVVGAIVQFRHDRNAGHSCDVVAQDALTSRFRILGARTPKRIADNFRLVAVLCQQMNDLDTFGPPPVEQALLFAAITCFAT